MIALNEVNEKPIRLPLMPPVIKKARNNHLYVLNIKHGSWPLFIIPGIGGKNDRFRMFGNIFREICTVYGLEMMGTQRDETPLRSIEAIAAQNILWIKEVQPEGPYRLLGYSYGANILYEMVCQLEAAGESVDFAAILDQPIGELEGMDPELSKLDLVQELLQISRDYYESFRIPFPEWGAALESHLSALDMETLVMGIADFVRQEWPQKANSIAYVSRLINIRLYNTSIVYSPSLKINAEVIVFNAKSINQDIADDTLGWSAYAANVRSIIVPGNHHSIVWGNNVHEVSRHLRDRITMSR